MIFYAMPGQAAAPPVVTEMEQQAATPRIYRAAAAAMPPAEISLGEFPGEQAQFKPEVSDVLEQFDWSRARVRHEFVRLEQRVLAKQASAEQRKRYESMKRDRNGKNFADRYVRDYAEVQRLKKLSGTLTEIQQYLRPIELR